MTERKEDNIPNFILKPEVNEGVEYLLKVIRREI